MAFKAMLFLLACFLLVNIKGGAIAPHAAEFVSKSSPPPPTHAPAPVVKSPPPPPPPTWPPKHARDCEAPCRERCRLNSRAENVCLRACTTCCLRCKCVPPGPYAKKEICGTCYANMTTTGGRPKCP